MARKRANIPLNVFLNGRRVGVLNRQTSGAIDFVYDQDWLDWEHSLPVSRSMPLRDDRYIGDPVIAVFDNLLPDNNRIRKRVAERTGAKGIDAYHLLLAVGRDCVGALQFLPDGMEPGDLSEVEGRRVSDADIAQMIRNLDAAPLGLGEDDDFRISIAGAQEKTALLKKRGRWMKPIGTTPTTHILKPAMGKLPNGIDMSLSVENEYLCLKLCEALGCASAKAELIDFEESRVLVVERFDRQWTKDGRLLRVPQEDCCQALSVPPSLKYENEGGPSMIDILDVLKESDAPSEDQAFFMRAQIIFWLLAATDGHAKNFSVFLQPGGGFRMTPLYDVLSVAPSFAAGQIQRNKMKLAMAVGDKRHYALHRIAQRHFEETAKKAGVDATMVEHIFDDIRATIPKALGKIADALPSDFPDDVSGPIFEKLEHFAKSA